MNRTSRLCGLMLAFAMTGAVPAQAGQGASDTVYVGSRTTQERQAHGRGIETYNVSPDGGWTHLATTELVNPSFLITNRAKTLLFAVHGDREEVSSFRIAPATGALERVSTVGTGGENPVHLALSPDERYLVLANYGTGSVSSFPVGSDGRIGAPLSVIDLPGELGRNRVEQTSAQPHMVLFDPAGEHIIVPAKGLDRVFVMSLDDQGRLDIESDVRTRVGAGPRHAAFGPNGQVLYVVNEIDSTIVAYRYRDGTLDPFQLVVTLPDDFTGNSRAAEIALSRGGRYLFATNRGHDSVVRLVVDRETGSLSDPEWVSSGGVQPRFLMLYPDGASVLVTNVWTDTVVRFPFDEENGKLGEGRVVAETGSPVVLAFGPKR